MTREKSTDNVQFNLQIPRELAKEFKRLAVALHPDNTYDAKSKEATKALKAHIELMKRILAGERLQQLQREYDEDTYHSVMLKSKPIQNIEDTYKTVIAYLVNQKKLPLDPSQDDARDWVIVPENVYQEALETYWQDRRTWNNKTQRFMNRSLVAICPATGLGAKNFYMLAAPGYHLTQADLDTPDKKRFPKWYTSVNRSSQLRGDMPPRTRPIGW